MSDSLPGSSWSNPIWHRGWRIYIGDFTAYEFVHDEYDGPEDNRCGHADSLAEAKAEIDLMEDDAQAEREEAADRQRMIIVGGRRDGGSAA